MGRGKRRRSRPKQRRIGPGHNEANRQTRESRSRDRMLNLGRENHFRYDLEMIVQDSSVEEEKQLSLRQMIVTKASRLGIPETKFYLDEKVDEGILEKETANEIKRLLDKYATYR